MVDRPPLRPAGSGVCARPLRASCIPMEASLGTHLWEGEPHFSQGQSELAGATQSAGAGCGMGLQASAPSQVGGGGTSIPEPFPLGSPGLSPWRWPWHRLAFPPLPVGRPSSYAGPFGGCPTPGEVTLGVHNLDFSSTAPRRRICHRLDTLSGRLLCVIVCRSGPAKGRPCLGGAQAVTVTTLTGLPRDSVLTVSLCMNVTPAPRARLR